MRCPFCGGPLKPERHANVEVDRCPTCTGLWFDRDELGAYVAGKHEASLQGRELPRVTGSTPVRCPRCLTDTLYPCRVPKLSARHCRDCGGTAVLLSPLSDLKGEDLVTAAATAAPDLLVVGGDTVIDAILDLLAGALAGAS